MYYYKKELSDGNNAFITSYEKIVDYIGAVEITEEEYDAAIADIIARRSNDGEFYDDEDVE